MAFDESEKALAKHQENENHPSATIVRPSGEEQEALLVDLGGKMKEQTMLVDEKGVYIRGFEQLPSNVRREIAHLIDKAGKNVRIEQNQNIQTIIFPHSISDATGKPIKTAAVLGNITHFQPPKKIKGSMKRANYLIGRFTEAIDFEEVQSRANALAETIYRKRNHIKEILTRYETHEVADDEIERTLDLLKNLEENRIYFKVKVGRVAAFLPSNQPLYALTCFGVVPALMARESHVKAPEVMGTFFSDLIEAIEMKIHIPNLKIATIPREEFVEDMTQTVRNAEGSEESTTDVVIFTGAPKNAEELRKRFRREVLFILNGAGHNPIVISSNADLEKAVEAAVSVQLYNQGQDCAAPNSILVHRDVHERFLELLRSKLKEAKVGPYSDPSVNVGPISRPNDLPRITELLIRNRQWLDFSTNGTLHAAFHILEPTIINKPLSEGGNFEEQFAPIFFVQMYEKDSDLGQYFEHKRYEPHAMYVTIFGTSDYIENLKKRKTGDGRLLHREDSILSNTHLHAEGQERGTEEYGGSGKWASSVSFGNRTVGMPTLPQREIGLLGKASVQCPDVGFNEASGPRIFHLKTAGITGSRSILHRVPKDITFKQRNSLYIKSLAPITRERIERLRTFIGQQQELKAEELIRFAYQIVEDPEDEELVKSLKRAKFLDILFHLLVGRIMGKGKESYLVRILSFCKKEKLLALLDMTDEKE